MTVRVLVADDQPLLRAGLVGIIGTAGDLSAVGEAGTGREAVRRARETRPDVVLMDVRMPDLDGIEATRRITRDPAAPKVLVLTTFDLDEYVYAALRAGAGGFLLKDTPPADLINAVRTVAAGTALFAPSVTRRLIARFAADRAVEPAAGGGPVARSRPDRTADGRAPAWSADREALSRAADREALTRAGDREALSRVADREVLGRVAEREVLGRVAEREGVGRAGGWEVLDRVTEREREVLLLVAEGLSNLEIAARLHITPGTAKTHVAHLLTKLDARDRIQLVILAYRSGLVPSRP